MNFKVTLNGAASGEGFLIGRGLMTSSLRLETTDGSTRKAQLVTKGPLAPDVHLSLGVVTVTPSGVSLEVTVAATSAAKDDIQIEISTDGVVDQIFLATSIDAPAVQFDGRYQCRLSTDPDGFDNLWGQDSSFGMYALPSVEPPLDRIIRFNSPVALRLFCPAIGVFVRSIRGSLVDNSELTFRTGDPLIGMDVRLGPNCKFDARDGNFAQPGYEPISDFEISIGSVFKGATDAGLSRPDSNQPPPSRAPYADGLYRMDMNSSLKPADFGYPDVTWTDRATSITTKKIADITAQLPAFPGEAALRDRRLMEHSKNLGGIQFALRLLERYSGVIDRNIEIIPSGSPVLQALNARAELRFYSEFFDFDTDCQSGTVWGYLG